MRPPPTSRALATLALAALAGAAHADDAPRRPYRVLHVMSYHSPWRWTDGQFRGFQEALEGLPVEWEVFQMDAKRQSTPEAKARRGREARAAIERFRPDLVYTTDDEAQEFVARHYVGTDLPFVFSGVNKPPAGYGFEGSPNVTGVVEHEHFVESLQLLRRLVPGARRIAVVFDDAPLWGPVRERMQAAVVAVPEVQVVHWDTIRTWEEFQRRVREYPASADAIALVGIFNFRDAAGRNVPYPDVLRWVAEHSALPDLAFWIDRVHHGTLCAVTVSEREQGLAAGRIARAILAEGRSPASFPMRPTVRGLPALSLARARALGITPTTGTLLSAEVVPAFEWERR